MALSWTTIPVEKQILYFIRLQKPFYIENNNKSKHNYKSLNKKLY